MKESNLKPLRDKDVSPTLVLRRALDRVEAIDIALVVTRTTATQGFRIEVGCNADGARSMDVLFMAKMAERYAEEMMDTDDELVPIVES